MHNLRLSKKIITYICQSQSKRAFSPKNCLKIAFLGDTNLDQVTLEGAGTPNFKSTDIFDMSPESLGTKAFR